MKILLLFTLFVFKIVLAQPNVCKCFPNDDCDTPTCGYFSLNFWYEGTQHNCGDYCNDMHIGQCSQSLFQVSLIKKTASEDPKGCFIKCKQIIDKDDVTPEIWKKAKERMLFINSPFDAISCNAKIGGYCSCKNVCKKYFRQARKAAKKFGKTEDEALEKEKRLRFEWSGQAINACKSESSWQNIVIDKYKAFDKDSGTLVYNFSNYPNSWRVARYQEGAAALDNKYSCGL